MNALVSKIVTLAYKINSIPFRFKSSFVSSFQSVVVALSLAIVANAGVISHDIIQPIYDGTVLQGPSTKTHLVGPDGSQIVAEAPGGRVDLSGVVAHEHVVAAATVPDTVSIEAIDVAPAVIAAKSVALDTVAVEAAPVVTSQIVAAAAPIVAHTKTSISSHSIDQVHPSPAIVAHTAPVVAAVHTVPTAAVLSAPIIKSAAVVAHSAPVVAHTANVVSHSSQFVAHTSPIVAHAAPLVAHASPLVAHTAPLVAHVSPVIAESAYISPLITKTAAVVSPLITSHSAHLIAHDTPITITGAVHAEHPAAYVSW